MTNHEPLSASNGLKIGHVWLSVSMLIKSHWQNIEYLDSGFQIPTSFIAINWKRKVDSCFLILLHVIPEKEITY